MRATRVRHFGSLEHELSQSGLLVESPIEADRIEPPNLDLVDHRGLGPEQMAPDSGSIGTAEGRVEVEERISPERNAPMQGKELVAIREDRLIIAARAEETELEILEHADAPQDGPAFDPMLARGGLEAREEFLPIREFDEDRVPFAARLHELTASTALPT